MPTITLQHCVPVTIHESEVPGEILLNLGVGGNVGDGTVDVHGTPNGAQPKSRDTASAGSHTASSCTMVTLHYRAASGVGAVVVSYAVTVS